MDVGQLLIPEEKQNNFDLQEMNIVLSLRVVHQPRTSTRAYHRERASLNTKWNREELGTKCIARIDAHELYAIV